MRGEAGDVDMGAILNERSYFTSHNIQDELLEITASAVLAKIVSQASKSFYSIIADETTDSSTSEQLCVAVRYLCVTSDSAHVEERFLCFVKVSSVTGMHVFVCFLPITEELFLSQVCKQ